MRYVAPAGTKIQFKDLYYGMINLLSSKSIIEDFKQAIYEKFNVKYCFLWGTGRTGMAFLLKSLYELDNNKRDEIIIPSYTCYSVPASIEYAGLKVRICDIDLQTLEYDYSKLKNQNFDNVLAILSANLYGIPNNLEKLEKLAKENKIYFIDDAAQSMGAKYKNRYAGTFGDAGLFSLDKGKNITTINGGITVTNSDKIAKKLDEYQNQLYQITLFQKIIILAKIIIYSIFLKPFLYWIPNRLLFLKLGQTLYDATMPEYHYDTFQAALGIELLNKLEDISKKRIDNALMLISKLKKIDEISLPEYTSLTEPVFLRCPVLVNEVDKPKLIKKLNSKGIGASCSYPESVFELEELRNILNHKNSNASSGKVFAKRIITLPTHEYVNEKDIKKIVSIFKGHYRN